MKPQRTQSVLCGLCVLCVLCGEVLTIRLH